MRKLDDVLNLSKMFEKKHKTPPKQLTEKQRARYQTTRLINKIKRGDLNYKQHNSWDRRLYCWGVKHGIIDKDCNILKEEL